MRSTTSALRRSRRWNRRAVDPGELASQTHSPISARRHERSKARSDPTAWGASAATCDQAQTPCTLRGLGRQRWRAVFKDTSRGPGRAILGRCPYQVQGTKSRGCHAPAVPRALERRIRGRLSTDLPIIGGSRGKFMEQISMPELLDPELMV